MAESIVLPSGSTNGLPIIVSATNAATAGTLIHACHATIPEEVYLWAANNHSGAVDLTIQFWLSGVLQSTKVLSLPARLGDTGIQAGIRHTAIEVRAAASVAGVIAVSANVNRTE